MKRLRTRLRWRMHRPKGRRLVSHSLRVGLMMIGLRAVALRAAGTSRRRPVGLAAERPAAPELLAAEPPALERLTAAEWLLVAAELPAAARPAAGLTTAEQMAAEPPVTTARPAVGAWRPRRRTAGRLSGPAGKLPWDSNPSA